MLNILLMIHLILQGAQLLHLLCVKLLATTRHERPLPTEPYAGCNSMNIEAWTFLRNFLQ